MNNRRDILSSIVLSTLFLLSCSEPDKPNNINVKLIAALDTPQSFKGTRILIWEKEKSSGDMKNLVQIADTNTINSLDTFLRGHYKHAYYCCFEIQYFIELFHENNINNTYSVTIEPDSDNVMIFDNSLNFGYDIHKRDWGKLLSKFISVKNSKHYFDSLTRTPN